MTEIQIKEFEKLQAQLESLHTEIGILAKKSPNDALNEFKLGFVNLTLKEINSFLDKDYLPYKNFTEFVNDQLPSNGDVVFILSQYLACLESLRISNIIYEDYLKTWFWKIEGKRSDLITKPPSKL
jgi:hypothetical protein